MEYSSAIFSIAISACVILFIKLVKHICRKILENIRRSDD